MLESFIYDFFVFFHWFAWPFKVWLFMIIFNWHFAYHILNRSICWHFKFSNLHFTQMLRALAWPHLFIKRGGLGKKKTVYPCHFLFKCLYQVRKVSGRVFVCWDFILKWHLTLNVPNRAVEHLFPFSTHQTHWKYDVNDELSHQQQNSNNS